MINIGDKVKVVRLIPDENGYASMPDYAVGNTYEVVDIQEGKYKYGLQGVDAEVSTYFREDELELV